MKAKFKGFWKKRQNLTLRSTPKKAPPSQLSNTKVQDDFLGNWTTWWLKKRNIDGFSDRICNYGISYTFRDVRENVPTLRKYDSTAERAFSIP